MPALNGKRVKPPTWWFSLVLADLPVMTEDAADRLYEAGCDDGLAGSSGGVSSVDFAREAVSLDAAIRSATADVRKAGFEVARVEIERHELDRMPVVAAESAAAA